jgi:hypothetical protein
MDAARRYSGHPESWRLLLISWMLNCISLLTARTLRTCLLGFLQERDTYVATG